MTISFSPRSLVVNRHKTKREIFYDGSFRRRDTGPLGSWKSRKFRFLTRDRGNGTNRFQTFGPFLKSCKPKPLEDRNRPNGLSPNRNLWCVPTQACNRRLLHFPDDRTRTETGGPLPGRYGTGVTPLFFRSFLSPKPGSPPTTDSPSHYP